MIRSGVIALSIVIENRKYTVLTSVRKWGGLKTIPDSLFAIIEIFKRTFTNNDFSKIILAIEYKRKTVLSSLERVLNLIFNKILKRISLWDLIKHFFNKLSLQKWCCCYFTYLIRWYWIYKVPNNTSSLDAGRIFVAYYSHGWRRCILMCWSWISMLKYWDLRLSKVIHNFCYTTSV